MAEESLSEWKYLANQEIELEINAFRTRCVKFETLNNIFNKDFIQDFFAVTPNDKANRNVAIICKRFYVLTLIKELGMEKHYASKP